jgi:hypothetical protein
MPAYLPEWALSISGHHNCSQNPCAVTDFKQEHICEPIQTSLVTSIPLP